MFRIFWALVVGGEGKLVSRGGGRELRGVGDGGERGGKGRVQLMMSYLT